MKDLAYIFVDGAKPGERIGIVKRDVSGYYLTDFDSGHGTDAEMKAAVAGLNEDMGVDAKTAMAMKIGSMFGWDVPGAMIDEREDGAFH